MKLNEIRMVLSLTCDEASRLASDGLDRELSRSERWALRLHAFLCGSCRRLMRQLATMRALLSDMPEVRRRAMIEQLPHLSADRKRQIKQLLNDTIHGELG